MAASASVALGADPRRAVADRGGLLAVLPEFGLWMLPLGLILIAEDVPVVRRAVSGLLDWLENRWPGLLRTPGAD